MYPAGWPRCACGEPVLDGHLTCGQLQCDERAARAQRQRPGAAPAKLAELEPLTDRQRRRYIRLVPLPADLQWLVEHYPVMECADCSAPIRHGFMPYALRLRSARAPATTTTEPVCARCTDRLLDWT